MAIRALWSRRRLAYQLLELLATGGTRVFVDGHDVDTPNDPSNPAIRRSRKQDVIRASVAITAKASFSHFCFGGAKAFWPWRCERKCWASPALTIVSDLSKRQQMLPGTLPEPFSAPGARRDGLGCRPPLWTGSGKIKEHYGIDLAVNAPGTLNERVACE